MVGSAEPHELAENQKTYVWIYQNSIATCALIPGFHQGRPGKYRDSRRALGSKFSVHKMNKLGLDFLVDLLPYPLQSCRFFLPKNRYGPATLHQFNHEPQRLEFSLRGTTVLMLISRINCTAEPNHPIHLSG
jgi:hypothetical protein